MGKIEGIGMDDLGMSLVPEFKEESMDEALKGLSIKPKGVGDEKTPEQVEAERIATEKAKAELGNEEPLALEETSMEDAPTLDTPADESPLKVYAELARAQGFIDYKDEEFEDSPDFIKNKMAERESSGVTKGIEEYKASLPGEVQHLIKHWEDGVSIKDLAQAESDIVDYQSITPETIVKDKELQKALVSDFYDLQEFEPEEKKIRIQRLEDSDQLKDEALLAQRKLVKFAERRKQLLIEDQTGREKARRDAAESELQGFQKRVMDTKEIFPEIPFTEANKRAVIEAITKKTERDEQGNPITKLQKLHLTDPMFLPKVAYLASIMNWDFSVFKRKGITQGTQKIKDTVDSFSADPLYSKLSKTASAAKRAVNALKNQNK